MTKLGLFALFFIAIWTDFTWAAGPIVYKCGSSYSQIPCDGAMAVKVDDSRSKEQKSQSDAEVVQQRQKANAMEKSRLQEEAQALAHNKPAPKPPGKPTPKTKKDDDLQGQPVVLKAPGASKNTKKRNTDPEFFTAKETADLKKKPAGTSK
jgi:hypothetical protein